MKHVLLRQTHPIHAGFKRLDGFIPPSIPPNDKWVDLLNTASRLLPMKNKKRQPLKTSEFVWVFQSVVGYSSLLPATCSIDRHQSIARRLNTMSGFGIFLERVKLRTDSPASPSIRISLGEI